MPEQRWKQDAYWISVTLTAIAFFIIGLALMARIASIRSEAQWEKAMNKPITVHVVVHYQPIEQTHFEQWIGEVAISELQWKRSDCSGLMFYSTARPFGHIGMMRNLDELDNLLAKARQVDNKGKRGPLGALAPETLQAIELQTAKEVFSEGRDPFQARWK